jgi:integrase
MSRHIFQYAIITGRAEGNPAEHLKGMIKPAPKSHYAALDHRDLPEFLKALYSNKARLMPLTHLAVQFIMLTFVRTGEMIKAEWSEIDLDERIWLIPGKRMKMGKDHNCNDLTARSVVANKLRREAFGNPFRLPRIMLLCLFGGTSF